MRKKNITIFIDMDGVLCDFRSKANEMLLKNPKIGFPQSQYGFFESLKPIHNAVMVYKDLDERFNVHILTAPSYMNPLCYTEKRNWVENHLGIEAAEKMIISGYKNLCVGDYLIDDNMSGKGQDKFTGELILFNQISNDWSKILQYFADKYL